MYALLSPIDYVSNPRYHLTTPLQAALFYLAPGVGYLIGATFGGRWSGYIVKSMMARRHGTFIPEYRLRATFIPLGVVIPGCINIYGWTGEKAVGGIPLPVTTMVIRGIGQLCSLPTLNTYCLDVIPNRSAEVVALNYMMRYLFAAGGTAAALPVTNAIGLVWVSTICSFFLMTTTGLVILTSIYRESCRKRREREKKRLESVSAVRED